MKIIRVGRSSENDIVINDPYVGRSHCEFIQDDGEHYWIRDLNSKNGTYVNGNRISGEMQITSSDVVRIGNTSLRWLEYFPAIEHHETAEKEKKQVIDSSPLVNIPSEIKIDKCEEHISAEVRKRGDDFSVGFLRKMGDNIGNLLGNTIGCILSIILIIVFIAIIVSIA